MTKEEIINLANRCSRKIWEICMEEPGFSINDCPEGANGLSDIVLNVILKEFPATKKCSSIPSNLDEAAIDEAAKEYAKTTFKKPYSDNPDEEVTIVEPDEYAGFIAGAKWDKEQIMSKAVEYEVVDFSSSLDTNPHINVPLDNKKYRSGDKVYIIIVEEN